MPRKARIDAAGALHHLMVRGIERRAIFRDDLDRDRFLERLEKLLKESSTSCYAWAILPNHVHLLVRTGTVPIATFMRRLLTGYAMSFNKRYKRHGHLFQNRYKSVLCEEDPYFLELVRYIHLNPLRTRIVDTMEALDAYPYSGHSALIDNKSREGQDTLYVLAYFSSDLKQARALYRAFVEKGIAQGSRTDLSGGGVIRSSKGWRPSGIESERPKGDERILGDNAFVVQTLKLANEKWERSYRLKAQGIDFGRLLEIVSEDFDITTEEILSPGKHRHRVMARSVLCYWAVTELKMTATALAKELGISQPAVSNAVSRGERIVRGKRGVFGSRFKNL
jgi:putative transposase